LRTRSTCKYFNQAINEIIAAVRNDEGNENTLESTRSSFRKTWRTDKTRSSRKRCPDSGMPAAVNRLFIRDSADHGASHKRTLDRAHKTADTYASAHLLRLVTADYHTRGLACSSFYEEEKRRT